MEHTTKQLRDNWVILVFIVGLIVTWTTFNTRLTQAETDIRDLKELSQQLNQQALDIAVIKTDVGYIKGRVQ